MIPFGVVALPPAKLLIICNVCPPVIHREVIYLISALLYQHLFRLILLLGPPSCPGIRQTRGRCYHQVLSLAGLFHSILYPLLLIEACAHIMKTTGVISECHDCAIIAVQGCEQPALLVGLPIVPLLPVFPVSDLSLNRLPDWHEQLLLVEKALLGWDALNGTEVEVQVQFRPPSEALVVLVVEGVLGQASLRLGICDALAFKKLRLLGGKNLDLKRLVVDRHRYGAFKM